MSTPRLPSYRHQKARNLAVVRLNGKDHYLGEYESPESYERYEKLVGEWLARGRQLDSDSMDGEPVTIGEVMAGYLQFADEYYRKRGKHTSEYQLVKSALRCVRIYEDTPAQEFGPLALDVVRQEMLAREWSRATINSGVGRIRRMFRWAVSKEIVDPEVLAKLDSLPGLAKGRTTAKEPDKVTPVAEDVVDKTLPHLPQVVADMVRVQQLTGMRPDEVCALHCAEIDRTEDVWAFTPGSHKLEHHELKRSVYLGPKTQQIIGPYILRAGGGYVFSPKDSERRRRAKQHAKRKTPLNQGCRPKPGNKYQRFGDRYRVDSYRRAIHRACAKAGVPRWNPNQLRHSAATEIRNQFGIEAAQSILGHQKMQTTEFYAEKSERLARRIAREVG